MTLIVIELLGGGGWGEQSMKVLTVTMSRMTINDNKRSLKRMTTKGKRSEDLIIRLILFAYV